MEGKRKNIRKKKKMRCAYPTLKNALFLSHTHKRQPVRLTNGAHRILTGMDD